MEKISNSNEHIESKENVDPKTFRSDNIKELMGSCEKISHQLKILSIKLNEIKNKKGDGE